MLTKKNHQPVQPKVIPKDYTQEALVDKVNGWSLFKITQRVKGEMKFSYRIYFGTSKKKFQVFTRLNEARGWAAQNNEAPAEAVVAQA